MDDITLEGTYEWVKTMLGLLEERDFVTGSVARIVLPGLAGAKGTVVEEKVSVVKSFESAAKHWVGMFADRYYCV